MQQFIKIWFKYFMFVEFFGICVNLLYLTIPIYILIIYDRVLFSFSKATLYTLSVGLLISLLIMAFIDFLRKKILAQDAVCTQ